MVFLSSINGDLFLIVTEVNSQNFVSSPHFPTFNLSLNPIEAVFKVSPESGHISSPPLMPSQFKPLTHPTLSRMS